MALLEGQKYWPGLLKIFCFSLPQPGPGRGCPVRPHLPLHRPPRAVHLRQQGDPAHRDQVGLQGRQHEGAVLHQPGPLPPHHQQGE